MSDPIDIFDIIPDKTPGQDIFSPAPLPLPGGGGGDGAVVAQVSLLDLGGGLLDLGSGLLQLG